MTLDDDEWAALSAEMESAFAKQNRLQRLFHRETKALASKYAKIP